MQGPFQVQQSGRGLFSSANLQITDTTVTTDITDTMDEKQAQAPCDCIRILFLFDHIYWYNMTCSYEYTGGKPLERITKRCTIIGLCRVQQEGGSRGSCIAKK